MELSGWADAGSGKTGYQRQPDRSYPHRRGLALETTPYQRKAARSFSTVNRLMENIRNTCFCRPSPSFMIFSRGLPRCVRAYQERVKEGKWEPAGAMWVECDCNIASGESIIRQILVGKNFFRKEFNYESEYLWLPDVFGYSWALPQILKKTRCRYLHDHQDQLERHEPSALRHFPLERHGRNGSDGSFCDHEPIRERIITPITAIPVPRRFAAYGSSIRTKIPTKICWFPSASVTEAVARPEHRSNRPRWQTGSRDFPM